MISIFSNLVDLFLEIFTNDFSVYGESVDDCLINLGKVLRRCQDKHLTLNQKKCHSMVKSRIILGHIISNKGIKVDRA